MSNPYSSGGYPLMGPGGAPQYTPNQLLAQQYGQGSRAFYSPFNSPYRPLDTANGEGGYAGGFQPPRGYGGGRLQDTAGDWTQIPPDQRAWMQRMGVGPSGQAPGAYGPQYAVTGNDAQGYGWAGGRSPNFSPAQPAMPPPYAMTGNDAQGYQWAGGRNPFAPGAPGMPGAPPVSPQQLYQAYQNTPPGAGRDQLVRQMQGTDNGAAYRAAMHQQGYQLNQGPGGGFSYSGGPVQSGRDYGLQAIQNFASQQNAGPPPSAYQPGSFSAAVAALNRGNPNAQTMLGQAAGLPAQSGRDYGLQAIQNFASQQNAGPPPPPAQPFGPAFRNAVNQLRVQPPAPPQRLPYQPGATAQMMQFGRRRPALGPAPVAPTGLNPALGTPYGQTGTMATPQGPGANRQTFANAPTANDMTSGAPTGLNPGLGTAYGGRTVANPYAPGRVAPDRTVRRGPVGY